MHLKVQSTFWWNPTQYSSELVQESFSPYMCWMIIFFSREKKWQYAWLHLLKYSFWKEFVRGFSFGFHVFIFYRLMRSFIVPKKSRQTKKWTSDFICDRFAYWINTVCSSMLICSNHTLFMSTIFHFKCSTGTWQWHKACKCSHAQDIWFRYSNIAHSLRFGKES